MMKNLLNLNISYKKCTYNEKLAPNRGLELSKIRRKLEVQSKVFFAANLLANNFLFFFVSFYFYYLSYANNNNYYYNNDNNN